MKQITKQLLRQCGYEMRRVPRPPAVVTPEHGNDLAHYFNMTEGMISFEEAQLLYSLAKDVNQCCIIEVGSYRGRSSVALGRGSLDGRGVPVFAFDPHEEFTGVLGGQFGAVDRAAFYRAMLATDCYQVVRLINLSSELASSNWNKDIALLWIDGDHAYPAVKRDFHCWAPYLTKNATVAFDDSLDPRGGPRQFIGELLETRQFQQLKQVGKITVLKKA
jgi:predicted O-methyltransferase YrrM